MNSKPNPFVLLDRAEQRERVRKLAHSRYSDESIAAICGWSIEMVRRCLSEEASEEPAP
jgi:hypothetical protein